VTCNLATALVDLRSSTEPRVLWIDALCINQEDMQERSSQVARMANIYRQAKQVVVWLGPKSEPGGSTEALSTLRSIGSQVDVDWVKLEMRATDQGDPSWADKSVPLGIDHTKLSPVIKLLNRSWFERVWVQQEIALANDNALFVCGHDSITRRQFTNAIFCLRMKRIINKWDQRSLFRARLELARTMAMIIYSSRDQQRDADILREQARTLKCLNPRDRIFAILNISNFSEAGGSIEADYSRTTEEVYRDFTVKHILHLNSLELLTTCEIERNHQGLPKLMPSWVPDWRRPIIPRRLEELQASGKSAPAAHFDYKKETLTLTGVKCASVTRVQPTSVCSLPNGYDRHKLADCIQRCVQFWGLSEQYVAGGNSHDAHLRTLCGDRFSHRYNPPAPNLLNYEFCSSALSRFLKHQFKDEDNKWISPAYTDMFASRILAVCQGRSCFTTTEDYIGLGPSESKTGDIICVLLGCPVPMILRPNGEEKFFVVGECYCHGIMDGAALLGPLPEGFEFVWSFIQGRDRATYMNRCNGEVQMEDPRLTGRTLPPRWRIDTCNKDGVESARALYFVEENDDGTEKKRTDIFDPRMTSEELSQRGTPLAKFTLI